jgi:hypothetical protein
MDKLPIFLEQPAKCEVRGDTVLFIWDEFQIALPIQTCIANMAACKRAISDWEKRKGGIVKFKRNASH